MIVPDVNVLLYVPDSDAALHPSASDWWESVVSGPELIGIADVVDLAVVRLTTNRRIFPGHSPRRMPSPSWLPGMTSPGFDGSLRAPGTEASGGTWSWGGASGQPRERCLPGRSGDRTRRHPRVLRH